MRSLYGVALVLLALAFSLACGGGGGNNATSNRLDHIDAFYRKRCRRCDPTVCGHGDGVHKHCRDVEPDRPRNAVQFRSLRRPFQPDHTGIDNRQSHSAGGCYEIQIRLGHDSRGLCYALTNNAQRNSRCHSDIHCKRFERHRRECDLERLFGIGLGRCRGSL